jgi:DNA-nicking Smr family endonuclease
VNVIAARSVRPDIHDILTVAHCSHLGPPNGDDGTVKLKLDLHEIYNRGADIDRALQSIIDEAVAKRAPLVEIIPGKGSGQLKKRVLRFLDRKDIRALYHRVEKDSDNYGRIFVHFRWK